MEVDETSMSSVEEYQVEELNSNDVPESELAQFEETQPLEVVEIIANETSLNKDAEGTLIKKFVYGEGEFPDLYTKLEPEEEDDDEDEFEENELEQQEELPTTSAAAARMRTTKIDLTKADICMIQPTQLAQEQQQQHRQRTSSTFRKRTMLNAALQGLMGQANLSYARGQIEIAEKICLEIIRQNPLASEPFFTLAEIYENRDTEKYLNFLTIAAHLNPGDRDQWIRIAEMHIAQGNLTRARIYYTKAIKVLSKDYDLRLRKAQLLEKMGETNVAMFTYLKMLPHLPTEHAELCLMTAKKVAKHFHSISKPQLALEAMEAAYTLCANLFSLEDLNLYMELLLLNKEYAKVLRCLQRFTNLELETEETDNLDSIIFCAIPDEFLPDFRAKLCVSLIQLQAHHLLGYLVQNVKEHLPLDHLELYIDIAEALMQQHKYAEAIALLRPITDGDQLEECPAFVWLRQAECLRHLNRTSEAIESYMRVVELAPFCYEAKFTLSALLKQQGRHLEAVKALEQSSDIEGQPPNARLLYERCVMLQQLGKIDEFLEVGCVLLGRHSVQLRNREEMIAAANGGSFYNAEGLKVILQMRNLTEDTDKELQEYNKPQADNSDLTINDEYLLFMELVRIAFEHRKFSFIERICFAMVTTKRFVGYHVALERIIILACYFNDDCTIAFSYLRELITKDLANTSLWNLLALLVQKGHYLRYHRYVSRIVVRQPCIRQMRIFIGHYHLYCGSYKYALNIYVPCFKESPSALLALCTSVVFNQLSLQKKVLRKTAAVGQAIAFATKYAALRGGVATLDDPSEASTHCVAQQEIYYNIGRIYHQAGLMHLAIKYYEHALAVRHELIEAHEAQLGLKQEIAFNLHLIYRNNGNPRKARQYLYDYCVV